MRLTASDYKLIGRCLERTQCGAGWVEGRTRLHGKELIVSMALVQGNDRKIESDYMYFNISAGRKTRSDYLLDFK